MTIPVNSAAMWKARFTEETNRNIKRAEEENENAIVNTRQLTEEEMEKIFGNDPNYIKEIKI